MYRVKTTVSDVGINQSETSRVWSSVIMYPYKNLQPGNYSNRAELPAYTGARIRPVIQPGHLGYYCRLSPVKSGPVMPVPLVTGPVIISRSCR